MTTQLEKILNEQAKSNSEPDNPLIRLWKQDLIKEEILECYATEANSNSSK